ncbi:probable ATP-dependent RNA helicase DDX46 isoform X2 [Branchiostoma lanceolatum]|uniref:probable ATP-dependent RNA helicase DDX46 isoform X2 n=1 Tax=Branchiostoma lanceolatum TaxID=7740 RepID=UPI003453C468
MPRETRHYRKRSRSSSGSPSPSKSPVPTKSEEKSKRKKDKDRSKSRRSRSRSRDRKSSRSPGRDGKSRKKSRSPSRGDKDAKSPPKEHRAAKRLRSPPRRRRRSSGSPGTSRSRRKSRSPSFERKRTPVKVKEDKKSPRRSQSKERKKSPSPSAAVATKSRSKSPAAGQKAPSRSPSPQKTRSKSPHKKSHSKSPVRSKKSCSPSPGTAKKSRSRSPGKRKKSLSPVGRKKRSKSRSPSPSPAVRRKRSRSRSRDRDRKRRPGKKSPPKVISLRDLRRSRSRSPIRRRLSPIRRSPRRRRSRSRSKGRRSPIRRRSRSPRHKTRHSRSRSRSKSPKKEEKVKEEKEEVLDKDAEQKRLEEEMIRRRERVEKWRQERKKQEDLQRAQEAAQEEAAKIGKKWSLEDDEDDSEEEEQPMETNDDDDDDDDDDEEGAKVKKEAEGEEDEIDPLDAFMNDIKEEVKQINKKDQDRVGKVYSSDTTNGSQDEEDTPLPPALRQDATGSHANKQVETKGKLTVITAVAKKTGKREARGELIEQNQDALEWSSEEEEEDLGQTLSSFQSKAKKLLASVDHTQIEYDPFRKDFYVEVPELQKLSEDEVKAIREEMEDVRVKGKGCPKPILHWVQSGVSKKVLSCLKKHGFEKPTPIQAQAIPVVMSGRDMIGIAKTGSGKTLAFLIPMFRHILDQRPLEDTEGPIGVIMTPTRELALQITKECKKFTRHMNLKVVCVYGGTGISEQIAELKRGAEMIICTPGRMIDMLAANNGRVTNLRRCTYLVLDEADRMFDMGFEPQVMHIVNSVRPDRQTVMFSATFPRNMEALARKVLQKPIEVQVGGRSVVCSDVEQHVVVLEDEQKFFKLLELLGNYQEKGSVLVFVERQEIADTLLRDLLKAAYPCLSLHGGIDQYDRDSIINDFKSGNCRLLVATSVAARGLDVKQLILVINYDCPNHYEDYVHRVGRTGRAGNKGFAYTFITEDQGRYAGDVIKALELSEIPVPEEVLNLWTEYVDRQKAEGKAVKKTSGFTGKGFKFDETEQALADERRKLQKAALGLQDSDEEDAAVDIDQQIEDMFASKKRVKDVTAPVANVQTTSQPLELTKTTAEKLELAKRLATRINMQRNLGDQAQDVVQQAASAVMKGEILAAPAVSAKTIAEQMADRINAKLGYTPQASEDTQEEQTNVETFKRYEEELEINDFPQTVRWKVTSKEALAHIQEYSEAGITVRGTYFPPGKEVKEGERKIYLAIESTNEMSVQKAKAEIKRLIKEELVRLQNSYQPLNKGRYKVM